MDRPITPWRRTGEDDARSDPRVSRRRVLAAGSAVGLSAWAGCLDFLPWGGSGGTAATETSPAVAPRPHGTTGPEADVVGLVRSKTEPSSYEFFVTLSAPAGRGLGATWWQVETLSGEKIDRLAFAEPRGSRFTTSKVVELPDDVTAVVVRGHGRESGYGGLAMLAHLETDVIRVEDQGAEPWSFEGYTFTTATRG